MGCYSNTTKQSTLVRNTNSILQKMLDSLWEDSYSNECLFNDKQDGRKHVKSTPKEIVMTEARKMIRTEKLEKLEIRKSNRILEREIEKFKTRLDLDRTLNKLNYSVPEDKLIRQTSRQGKDLHQLSSKKMTMVLSLAKFQEYNEISVRSNVSPHKQVTKETPTEKQQIKRPASKSLNSMPKISQSHQIKSKNNFGDKDKPNVDKGGGKCKILSAKKEVDDKECQKVVVQKSEIKAEHTENLALVQKIVSRKIMFHYWLKWRMYVLAAKSKRDEEKMWREKINSFMKRCNERVAVMSEKKNEAISSSTQKNPCMQKEDGAINSRTDVLHKQKFDKTDYKVTKEKINNSTKNVLQITNEINCTLQPQLKCKAKLIRQFAPKPDSEEILIDLIHFPNAEIAQEMDRKHNERKQRLQIIHDQRKRIEEEKDRLAKERYEQQVYEIEMEKKLKRKEFQKKLRIERQQLERKRAQLQRMKELEELAAQHYSRKLLTTLGINPWRFLVTEMREKSEKALEHNTLRICRGAFRCWRQHLEAMENERVAIATAHYSTVLLKQFFRSWTGLLRKRYLERQVAEDWYDYMITRNTFKSWQMYTITQQIDRQQKLKQAVVHCRTKLLGKCLKYWMLLPQTIRLERAKEIRKKEWREKVLQVLPDFRPVIYAE